VALVARPAFFDEAAELGCGEAVAGLFWDSEGGAYEGGAV